MKIESVESILAGRWHFVRITTDNGIQGVGESGEQLAAGAKRAVSQGFTAVRFTPFRHEYTSMRYSGVVDEAIRRVGAVREAVGPDVDLCVEIHRRMSPMEAIGLSQELVQF